MSRAVGVAVGTRCLSASAAKVDQGEVTLVSSVSRRKQPIAQAIMQVKVKPVRPGLAKPVHRDALRVLPLARGANPHIPSGTRQSENSFKVRMYGCNLSDFCITELIACTKGASMYAMTKRGRGRNGKSRARPTQN